MKLLAVVLSPMGLEKVEQIRQADDDFKANGSKRGPGGAVAAVRMVRLRVVRMVGLRAAVAVGDRPEICLGAISITSLPRQAFDYQPWMLQFGGHHLALNITVAGSRGVLTPTLTGAQPTAFQFNGKNYSTPRQGERQSARFNAIAGSEATEAGDSQLRCS